MSLRRFFGTESDKRVPERAKERGRAGASTVDRKLAAQRALVAVRLREAQQEGALLPQRVCLLMEGQATERGEPARHRHHEEGSAAAWKGTGFAGGWRRRRPRWSPAKKPNRPALNGTRAGRDLPGTRRCSSIQMASDPRSCGTADPSSAQRARQCDAGVVVFLQ